MTDINYNVPMSDTSLILKNGEFFLLSKDAKGQESLEVKLEGDAKKHSQQLLSSYLGDKVDVMGERIKALSDVEQDIDMSSLLHDVEGLLKDIHNMEVPRSKSTVENVVIPHSSTDYEALCHKNYTKYQKEFFEVSRQENSFPLGTDSNGLVEWEFEFHRIRSKFLSVSLPHKNYKESVHRFPSGVNHLLLSATRRVASTYGYEHLIVTLDNNESQYNNYHTLTPVTLENGEFRRGVLCGSAMRYMSYLKDIYKPTLIAFDASLSKVAHYEKRFESKRKIFDYSEKMLKIISENKNIVTIFSHYADETQLSSPYATSKLFVDAHSHKLAYRSEIDTELSLRKNHALLYDCSSKQAKSLVLFENP